ncbi:MAG: hypothetical protein O7C75_14805 [Verrucomicrobia bacterium]|nr:hypothetical protein [Verrucomicrobiota bacterium]
MAAVSLMKGQVSWKIMYPSLITYIVGCLLIFISHPVISATPSPSLGFELSQKQSDSNRAVRISKSKYQGPIFDAHIHYNPPGRQNPDNATPEMIWKMLKSQNVTHALVMPTPNEGHSRNHDEGAKLKQELVRVSGGKVQRFCGSNYLNLWLHRAYHEEYNEDDLASRLDLLRKDLMSGKCIGIGEIATYHFEKNPRQSGRLLEIPFNFPPFLKIVSEVAKNQRWFLLHAEPMDPNGKSFEAQVFGGIALLYEQNSELKLILAHSAMTNSDNVRQLLLHYPSLMVDLKLVTKHHEWRYLEPIVNTDDNIYEDWAKLFEEFPTRFLVGTDAKFGRQGWTIEKYVKRIASMRKMLGSLPTDVAQRIAYENVHELIKKL